MLEKGIIYNFMARYNICAEEAKRMAKVYLIARKNSAINEITFSHNQKEARMYFYFYSQNRFPFLEAAGGLKVKVFWDLELKLCLQIKNMSILNVSGIKFGPGFKFSGKKTKDSFFSFVKEVQDA